MSDIERKGRAGHGKGGAAPDSEASLQRELLREAKEGADAIGDVRANRNLTGSSTWDTLPVATKADGGATDPNAAKPRPADAADEERQNARDELANRLDRRGVRLSGRETGEELVMVLEAVERFESAVQDRGGDLMVDEPIGSGSPLSPDHAEFVLPKRKEGETVVDFVERIVYATARAKGQAD